jgi:large subunit ribosomal protein L4
MKLDIYNIEGKSTGNSVDLPDSVFGVEPNEHVMYLDVKLYLANQRQGTHKAKERNEIAGSTRKLKRQKGTGTARAGSIKSPVFRGGGRIFGPKPRNYGFKLNKKVRSLARKSALSQKAANQEIMVVEDFTMDAPSTSQLNGILKNLNLADNKTVLVVNDYDKNIYLSGRNLPKAQIIQASDLSTYAILNNKKLVLSAAAVNTLSEMLS